HLQEDDTQTFTPYIWIEATWANKLLSWQPDQFCGIEEVSVPRELLWKPDLFLYETTERSQDITGSPYIMLKHDGTVVLDGTRKVVSTCAMDAYKFPFDSQNCTFTFISAIHSDKELCLVPSSNSSMVTLKSRNMSSTDEWEFINATVEAKTLSYQEGMWSAIVYTISIRRVSLLHVLTFILPILFLLILDVASFFMSDTRGEKMGFKVTVLLAMSVLLLILNDTLPSKPRRTPLIAVYVIISFGFMLLSLLESILVGYLIDSGETQGCDTSRWCNMEKGVDPQQGDTGDGNRKSVDEVICVANGECQQEATPMTENTEKYERGDPVPLQRDEGGDYVPLQRDEGGDPVPLLLRLILQELQRDAQQNQPPIQNRNSVVRYINTTFFILYLLSISIFLPTLFLTWMA
ncbi:5-hydroxytryptamine receptor 3A-like, partial [Engraulis encrasicolus]|uniref:5-hydroxytryptamine receptor 3A-like n=1 Tax=Engraulis encrasicolus TaxID=184585 RepID=UPI002FD6E9C3